MKVFSRGKAAALLLFIILSGGAGAYAADTVSGTARNGSVPGEAYSVDFAAAAEMAVTASPELKHAYAEQGISEQSWRLGVRAYFPRVGISVSENDRLQEIGADTFQKNYAVNVDQLLWDGGRTSMSRNLRRMELNVSRGRLEQMASGIAETALSAYRNILSTRAVLDIRKASLETLTQQRRILAGEVELGLALAADLAGADLAIAEAEIEILSLESDLAEAEKQLAEILGLDTLPFLSEKIDIKRGAAPPSFDNARNAAEGRNPELAEARFAVIKSQGELRYASRSWIPSFRLQGSFGLGGRTYPLTRHNWTLGINIELAGPWLQNSFTIQTGWEPPYDRTALLQNNLSPLPDPASALTKRQAQQVLALEREKYRLAFRRVGRSAERGVEKCLMADKARNLAVESVALAGERCRLEELRLGLGQITRLDLMETLLEYTQKEIEAVNAAVRLLEAERDLERLLNLKPGRLAAFASGVSNSDLSARSLYD